MKKELIRLMELYHTLPNSEATKILMEKICKAYANHFNVDIFEIVWKTEAPSVGVTWNVFSRYDSHIIPHNDPTNIGFNPPSYSMGLFHFCSLKNSKILVRNLKALASGEISEVEEEYSREIIQRQKYHVGNKNTEDELIVPMIIKDNVVGLLNLESDQANIISDQIVEELDSISLPIAKIIEKSETDRERRAIMMRCIEEIEFNNIQPIRKRPLCVLIRPFHNNFIPIEETLKNSLKGLVDIEVIKPDPSEFYIFNEIINHIKSCNFAIADITNMNSNVLIEIGLIIGFEKQFILIKNGEDETEIPFDLKSKQIFEYKCIKEGDGRRKVAFPDNFNNTVKTIINKNPINEMELPDFLSKFNM